MVIQINEPTKASFAFFNLGFRPFFLLSAIVAALFVGLWGLSFSGLLQLNNHYGSIHWHSHEMLFGYTAAVVAGFLLTAVKNWTQVDTITKTPLALLTGIWVLARILPFTPINDWLLALVDVSFFFFLTLAVAHPIIKAKQWNNLIMVFIISLLMLADILVQGEHLGLWQDGVRAGNSLALYSVLLIIQVLTGRVMPFFTRVVVPDTQVVERPLLERVLLINLMALALADVLALPALLISALAAILLIAHLMRVLPWFSKPVLNTPILWVLYAGYLWLLIGLFLKILVGFDLIANNLALHAWTVGMIGVTTYGMMARVSLGHTGREMLPSKLAIWGFYCLFFAAIIRVILPIFLMSQYVLLIQVSALLWCVAFVLFSVAYFPVLTQPRVDGQPG